MDNNEFYMDVTPMEYAWTFSRIRLGMEIGHDVIVLDTVCSAIGGP